MCVTVILCSTSGRVGDWYHCLVLGGDGSMYDVLYTVPPSIETKAHCGLSGGGVLPKKAADTPVHE